MTNRHLTPDDIPRLKEIHQDPDNAFPDFSVIQEARVIEANDGTIISAGGVELIAEGVLVVNPDCTPVQRGKALIHHLASMTAYCRMQNLPFLHAFENGDNKVWIRALENYGFRTDGRAYYKDVTNGQG